MPFEVVTKGFGELRAALTDVRLEVDPTLAKALRLAAEPVKKEAKRLAQPYSPRTAAGIRIRRKLTTVRVEQGQRKTTGYHPNYGPLQMRRMFEPALEDHKAEVTAAVAAAIDDLVKEVK